MHIRFLLCRYIPERLLHAQGTPRCIFLVFISGLTALVVCCNAFATLLLLFPASIMAGLAFGALWSLMATLTSEFFGLHHFASNYTFVQVGQKRKATFWLPVNTEAPVVTLSGLELTRLSLHKQCC